jgi:hypothetical protein
VRVSHAGVTEHDVHRRLVGLSNLVDRMVGNDRVCHGGKLVFQRPRLLITRKTDEGVIDVCRPGPELLHSSGDPNPGHECFLPKVLVASGLDQHLSELRNIEPAQESCIGTIFRLFLHSNMLSVSVNKAKVIVGHDIVRINAKNTSSNSIR